MQISGNPNTSSLRVKRSSGGRFLQSFGAMNELFSYLEELETLQFQLLNKLAYDTVVSRVQTSWKTNQRYIYLLHPFDKWGILEYDSRTNKVATVLSESFNFNFDIGQFVNYHRSPKTTTSLI